MEKRSANQLREDALAIWAAGVRAVAGHSLVQNNVLINGNHLLVGESEIDLAKFRQINVIGGGKAAGAMVTGLENSLQTIADRFGLNGWVNTPEPHPPLGTDLSTATVINEFSETGPNPAANRWIQKIPVRPAASNYPTQAAVTHTNKMLKFCTQMTSQDLCICLISGGGSALLCSPAGDITFKDKIKLAKVLQAEGADIRQLNTIRQAISRVKGGGLLRHCKAGHVVTLVISDIMGDPLELIASGPTLDNHQSEYEKSNNAIQILDLFDPSRQKIPNSIWQTLEKNVRGENLSQMEVTPIETSDTRHQIELIGNNAVALDAAGVEAEKRGYHHAMTTDPSEGLLAEANRMGRHQLEILKKMKKNSGPDCWISGGEPVVEMDTPTPDSLGGRNTQSVLAALAHSETCSNNPIETHAEVQDNPFDGICFLSGGTDGEDGPTPAAGAFVDSDIWESKRRLGLDSQQYLRSNDAFGFFRQSGGWIFTGPTHTNVCDLRVGLVDRMESPKK